MTLRPIDGGEVPDAAIAALEKPPVVEIKTEPGSEPSQQTPAVAAVPAKVETPKTEVKPEVTPAVPYHQDPNVQLYIERQVAKRVGEGKEAYEARLAKLEERLTKPAGPTTIGGWAPANEAEAKAARAIILQAKKELMEELGQVDQQRRQEIEKSDRAFSDFLGELRVTGILKTDEDEKEFARLIVEYKLEDQTAAVNLWNRLQETKAKAGEDGRIEGARDATAARVGSGRKGTEPGSTPRSYQARRLEEPNFDAIIEREMARFGK